MDKRSLEGFLDDFRTVGVGFEVACEVDEGDATTGDDTFGKSGFRSSNGVVDAELFLVDFGFGGATNFDDGDFTEKGGGAFLELFAGVIGFLKFGLGLDEGDAICDGFLVASTFDDSGFVFGGEDFVTGTEDFHADFFELHAFVAGNDGGVGQDGDVFHDFLAAVAEGWGFQNEGIEDAFELV